MADISYGSTSRDILFHILRYSGKEISRLSNISLCNVEGTHPLIWQKFPLMWQWRILAKLPVQCYVNGIIEILYKYVQSARSKYWLADGSTLRAWHLQVRQFWDKIRRIIPVADSAYLFHWITLKFWKKGLTIPLSRWRALQHWMMPLATQCYRLSEETEC